MMKQKVKHESSIIFFHTLRWLNPRLFMVSFFRDDMILFSSNDIKNCTQWNVMMRDIEQSLSILIQIFHVLRMMRITATRGTRLQ